MNRLLRDSILKAGFSPSQSILDFDEELRRKLGLTNRYDSARLAIGRSLADATPPEPIDRDLLRGTTPIRGEHLFGKEIDLWISAIVLENQFEETGTVEDFKQAVESHWVRGAESLREEWHACDKEVTRFISRLAILLPTAQNIRRPRMISRVNSAPGEIRISVGSVSQLFSSNEPIDFVLNGSGVSPHIALMGKTRSGKTTTGLQIAGQIVEKANVPFLLIDPKGEFLESSVTQDRLGMVPDSYTLLEVGVQPIPLDFLPTLEVGTIGMKMAAMQLRDSIALACRVTGDVQRDSLKSAIERVVEFSGRRDLEAVREAYENELIANNKSKDSIVSRLSDVTDLEVFRPELPPSEFFERSWVISLSRLESEELKRLVILLLLDAFKAHLLRLEEAPIESGCRGLRNLLVIDEARRILAEKKYQSLVDIVRQGASKGAVVMLLSQDPSDFDGQADDFTTQLGTVVAFACSQTERGLKKLQGVYGRKVQPQEFTDTHLQRGVAFCKLPGRHPERIRCC